jgi:carboxymethylenebutenolidase
LSHETIQIRTEDGVCPTHVFLPTGRDRAPAVIVFMDAFGIRPAMFEIAERLASGGAFGGYYVILPDLYYRSGWTARDAEGLFSIPEKRDYWSRNIQPTVSAANIMRDMPAWIRHSQEAPGAEAGKIGTTGYCLGGRLSITAAGTFPDYVAAAASYHGGGLATDAPDSPHLLAPAMKARVYVAGAIEDRGFDDVQKQRLEDALTEAHVDHIVETYNARHGWVPSDTQAHDPEAAEKHWRTLFALLDGTLNEE